MHTPFHKVLRFYPDPHDPIVITMSGGVDREQRICGHTQAGVEMGPDTVIRAQDEFADDLLSLACIERTRDRKRQILAPAEHVQLPHNAARWGLSIVAFDINAAYELSKYHLLMRESITPGRIDWEARTERYSDTGGVCFQRTRSDNRSSIARVQGQIRALRDEALLQGTQGALVGSLTGLLEFDDEMVLMAMRAIQPRERSRASTRVTGSGLLAF